MTPSPREKLACFTLDFELDYGGRLNTFETLKQDKKHEELVQFLKDENIPVSAFVQTKALNDHPEALSVLKNIACDFHSHSHTHASENFNSREEFLTSKKIIEDTFAQPKVGYRAPYGKLYPGDHELLQEMGFAFDSSIFPSFRPGKFNHLNASIEPTVLDCGLQEIPFAVIPGVRLILGISYMKLFGFSVYKHLISMFGLPDTLVFYGHMHDYFPTEGLHKLPLGLKTAFKRNNHNAMPITKKFFDLLKDRGYTLVTISELAHRLENE